MNPIREALEDENPDALLLEGFEAALVGFGRRCGQPTIAIYDYEKCIQVLADQGMDYESAAEFFEFNVVGAWVGENTPMILYRPEQTVQFRTTKDLDLGSLGGTLLAGAIVQPFTGNLKGNVALMTSEHWVDPPEGNNIIIGGWPEVFEGIVEPVETT